MTFFTFLRKSTEVDFLDGKSRNSGESGEEGQQKVTKLLDFIKKVRYFPIKSGHFPAGFFGRISILALLRCLSEEPSCTSGPFFRETVQHRCCTSASCLRRGATSPLKPAGNEQKVSERCFPHARSSTRRAGVEHNGAPTRRAVSWALPKGKYLELSYLSSLLLASLEQLCASSPLSWTRERDSAQSSAAHPHPRGD